MNVWLNADGTRNRENRPYIQEEESARSLYLYDPEGPGFNYGLYDMAQPSCGSWLNGIYDQYPSHNPGAVVTRDGRVYMVKPDHNKLGYKWDTDIGYNGKTLNDRARQQRFREDVLNDPYRLTHNNTFLMNKSNGNIGHYETLNNNVMARNYRY